MTSRPFWPSRAVRPCSMLAVVAWLGAAGHAQQPPANAEVKSLHVQGNVWMLDVRS